MLRESWKFFYSAGEVALGARKKQEYHEKRYEYWVKLFETVFKKIEDGGVKITKVPRMIAGKTNRYAETVAYNTGASNNAAVDFQVHIDVGLQDLLSRYRAKCELHKSYVTFYRNYAIVLEKNSSAEVPLDSADVMYFGLCGDEETEEEEMESLDSEQAEKEVSGLKEPAVES